MEAAQTPAQNQAPKPVPDAFQDQKVAYRWLRRAIGFLGIALPVTLSVLCRTGGEGCVPQTSISAYYHTDLRFLFITVLVLLSVLLLAYPGYDEDDDFAADLAGLFTMGVALFPTSARGAPLGVIGALHFTCAACMFVLLAIFCLCLFRRTERDRKPTGHKRRLLAPVLTFWRPPKEPAQPGTLKARRNRLFLVCGWIIIGSIVAMIAFLAVTDGARAPTSDFIYWCETSALVAFGVAWIVKGEWILSDPDQPAAASQVLPPPPTVAR